MEMLDNCANHGLEILDLEYERQANDRKLEELGRIGESLDDMNLERYDHGKIDLKNFTI